MKTLLLVFLTSLLTLPAVAGVKPSGPPSTEPVQYWEPPAEQEAPKTLKKVKKAAAPAASKMEQKK
ncbi:MAG: hypothetical protein WBJ21_03735 [Burkholderiaceae bacterium]